jgi:hypothetical protein
MITVVAIISLMIQVETEMDEWLWNEEWSDCLNGESFAIAIVELSLHK